MIVFEKQQANEIREINFHDAEIAKIICDYDEGTVMMPIIVNNIYKQSALLKFENVVKVEVNRKEPWGAGNYIFEVNVEPDGEAYFSVGFLLNSGDEITVIASKMSYEAIS